MCWKCVNDVKISTLICCSGKGFEVFLIWKTTKENRKDFATFTAFVLSDKELAASILFVIYKQRKALTLAAPKL